MHVGQLTEQAIERPQLFELNWDVAQFQMSQSLAHGGFETRLAGVAGKGDSEKLTRKDPLAPYPTSKNANKRENITESKNTLNDWN